MRIAILGKRMYDGDNATYKALSDVPGTRLFACFPQPATNAPIDLKMFSWLEDQYVYTPFESNNRLAHYFRSGDLDEAVLEQKLRAFDPEVFLVTAWHVPAYRRMLRKFPNALKIARQSVDRNLAAVAWSHVCQVLHSQILRCRLRRW